jgi:hypothetical protein
VIWITAAASASSAPVSRGVISSQATSAVHTPMAALRRRIENRRERQACESMRPAVRVRVD